MRSIPESLHHRLREFNQEHVLAWWDRLSDGEQAGLIEQLQSIDFQQLRQLYEQRDGTFTLPEPERIAPVPVVQLGGDTRAARERGEEALRRGEVAVLLVAGGQGSRLGFEHPKGLYEIGPVSKKSLFQLHAEKVLALGRRYGQVIPFLVMTSPATHDETTAYFAEKRNFGLPADSIHFFRQGTMPALELATGKLLMESPSRLFTSPNGHGGTLTALADSGLLERLERRGIKQVYYFQVDNPLTKIADPVFLGHHLQAEAEASSKAVRKQSPMDKLGNFVLIDGRCSIIEYSDLPESLARQTDEHGQLRLWAGSTAIHIFSVAFLKRVTTGQTRIPFHIARKKVPRLGPNGERIEPEKENALKFERFIFDVLPLAERWTVVETSRPEEFVPLKNATGPDSPETVRQAISNLAANWLAKAGVTVPRRDNGDVAFPLEISPLYALDEEELAEKVRPDLRIAGPTYIV